MIRAQKEEQDRIDAERALADAKARSAEASKIRELEERLAKEKKEAEEAAALAIKERHEAELANEEI